MADSKTRYRRRLATSLRLSLFHVVFVSSFIISPYCYAQTTSTRSAPSANITANGTVAAANATSTAAATEHHPDNSNDCRIWGCSDHGTCDKLSYTCKCDQNYKGWSCEVHSNPCPDGVQTCYNGALCVPKRLDTPTDSPSSAPSTPDMTKAPFDWEKEREKMEYDQAVGNLETDDALFNQQYQNHPIQPIYSCECVHHNSIALFDGEQCEHQLYTSCELGKRRSDFTFCLQGVCIKQIVSEPGAQHQGCTCFQGWTGGYCHIPPPDETIPINDLVPVTSSLPQRSLILAFVVIISLLFCISLVAFIYYSRRAAAMEHLAAEARAANELLSVDDDEVPGSEGGRHISGQVHREHEIS